MPAEPPEHLLDVLAILFSLVATAIAVFAFIDGRSRDRYGIFCELESKLNTVHTAFLASIDEHTRTGSLGTTYPQVNVALDTLSTFLSARYRMDTLAVNAAWIDYRYFLTEDIAKQSYTEWRANSAPTYAKLHQALLDAGADNMKLSRVMRRKK